MLGASKILVLAPHTDDAELGCGGTIARIIENGRHVFVAVFSTARDSLPVGMPPETLRNEFLSSMGCLGVPAENLTIYDYQVRRFAERRQDILEELVAMRKRISPELVFLPTTNDVHQDHAVVSREGVRAFRGATMLGYELPWNNFSFPAQAFVQLKESHVGLKLLALACYRSQKKMNRSYFDPDFIKGWARVRGLQAQTKWAEAFEVIRARL